LHPSAQAEFGKLLQELAEEFKVQVLVTTHSPYFLSQENPQANVLLERVSEKHQLRQTRRVPTDGGDWMVPFGLALGLDNREFQPWREAFFSGSDSMLLVEGPIDKEYFELLRDPSHGDHTLAFQGEIFAYGGKEVLRNSVLLRFIRNRYRRLFITFDLDAEPSVLRALESLGLERHRDYCGIGLNQPGKKAIEGLLPDEIPTEVYSRSPALVQQAMHGTPDEKESAKNRLKQLMLEEFKRKAEPGEHHFGRFYRLVREIDRALR
jgi:putative ATP-dependent endonuclease of the OLD family